MKFYNIAIFKLLAMVKTMYDERKSLCMDEDDFAELSFEEKKEYLKAKFEEMVVSIYYDYLGITADYMGFDSLSEEEKEVYPIAKSVALAVSKADGKFVGSVPKFKCFLHEDHEPSMNYIPQVKGFYCFGCGKTGEVVDLFNLINYYYLWQGKPAINFYEQMNVACRMFVNTHGSIMSKSKMLGSPRKHTDYIPYTKEMNRVRHSPFLHLVKIENDPRAIQYLEKDRGISLDTAIRLSVMVQYPVNEFGQSWGRGYLTFINADGSYVRRLFAEDKTLSANCPYPANKWWNKPNSTMGIFNGQVIDHCRAYGECCFVCESAIDALSLETMGFHAIALNGATNANRFVNGIDDRNLIKYICLSDHDDGGKEMAKRFMERNLFVPEHFTADNDTIFCKYKDVNECMIADGLTTQKELIEIEEQANEFYGF